MSPRSEPTFLARRSYRRRRLMDAARLLPWLGAMLLLLPILGAGDGGTAAGGLYVFAVWAGLIAAAAAMARGLGRADAEAEGDEAPGAGPAAEPPPWPAGPPERGAARAAEAPPDREKRHGGG